MKDAASLMQNQEETVAVLPSTLKVPGRKEHSRVGRLSAEAYSVFTYQAVTYDSLHTLHFKIKKLKKIYLNYDCFG